MLGIPLGEALINTIVVTVEGVLRKLTDGSRIHEGVELVQRLSGEGIGNNTIIHLTSGPASEAESWLDAHDIACDLVLGAREDRVLQLRRLRYEWGYPVMLVVEPDPDIAVDLMADGYTTMLFLHPEYAKPEWRPDHEHAMKTWDEIRDMRTKDIDRRVTDVRRTL